MILEIPDTWISQENWTEQDLKLHVALGLFQMEVWTLGQAAKFAGMPQFVFQQALAKRRIPVYDDAARLKQDVVRLKALLDDHRGQFYALPDKPHTL